MDGGWADPADPRSITAELKLRNTYSSSICLCSPPSTLGDALTFDILGRPINPRGRTGMQGRGLLGKWGPNHAADPIVTRFDPNNAGMLQVWLPLTLPLHACADRSPHALGSLGLGLASVVWLGMVSHPLTSTPS